MNSPKTEPEPKLLEQKPVFLPVNFNMDIFWPNSRDVQQHLSYFCFRQMWGGGSLEGTQV